MVVPAHSSWSAGTARLWDLGSAPTVHLVVADAPTVEVVRVERGRPTEVRRLPVREFLSPTGAAFVGLVERSASAGWVLGGASESHGLLTHALTTLGQRVLPPRVDTVDDAHTFAARFAGRATALPLLTEEIRAARSRRTA
jgi:hypothetical protein